ncbi:SRPBCC family protein [Streptomyces sp. CWNU-52B]|uniref:SRPBCC family protein n=1 Tax=unclassified Streptomyces TaxID=2593676 RepID=UPI0039BF9577
MVLFLVRRDTPLGTDEAWRRLTTWDRHAEVVPLTRVRVLTAAPRGAGTVFVARTGVGPVAFDDRMEVADWQPPRDGAPGLCRLVKRGRLVVGWAEIEVRPAAESDGGSRVLWREELGVRGLPRAFDPVLGRAGRWMFGRAVDGLLSRP